MYESLLDEQSAPPDHDIAVVTNTETQVYDPSVDTNDISVNTNPAYAITSAQQPADSSHTYVDVVDDSDYI